MSTSPEPPPSEPSRRRIARRGQVNFLLIAGSVLVVTAARAETTDATGSLAARPAGSEWWRLRPAQDAAIEVPKSEGAALPEARKAVRMVYPTPYQAR